MSYFKYINIPLYTISLLGCTTLGLFILPNLPSGSIYSFVCVVFIIFFFIIFVNQCLKAFATRDRDAELGAMIREKYESDRSNE